MRPAASPVPRYEVLLLGVILVLGLAGLPLPLTDGIDVSWQIMLAKAAIEGLDHGRDIVFSYGPLGVFENTHQLPELYLAHIAWQLGTRILAALILTGFLRELGRGLAWVIVVLAIVLLHSSRTTAVLNDPFYYVLILLSGLTLIREPVDWKRMVAATVLLGLLALVKFNLTLLTGAIVALAVSVHCYQRSWRKAGMVAAGFGLCVAAGWLGTGHSVDGIGQYLAASWHLASTYMWAMMFPAHPVKIVVALALIAGAAGLVVASRPENRLRAPAWAGALLMLATVGFMAWKHSFTRADPVHMPGLFIFLLFIFLIWPALHPLVHGANSPARRRMALVLGSFALAGTVLAARQIAPSAPARALQNLRANLAFALAPGASQQRFADETAQNCRTLDLPAIRAAAGSARVDVHGNLPHVAVANGLNFRPRLTLQSYSAFSPELAAENDRAMQRAAPEFVLLNAPGIDQRMPGLEDAIALRFIRSNFTPILVENGWVLHRRTAPIGADRPAPAAPEPARTSDLRWGESLALPDGTGLGTWLSVEINPTFLGRVVSFLYQAPLVWIELTMEDGTTQAFKLPPLMARIPFQLAPRAHAAEDSRRGTDGTNPLQRIQSVRILPGGQGTSWCYEPVIRMALSRDPS